MIIPGKTRRLPPKRRRSHLILSGSAKEETEPSDPLGQCEEEYEASGLPTLRPPCTITKTTFHCDMVRGEEDPDKGTVSWNLVHTHVYHCDTNSEDDLWFSGMKKHYENVGHINKRIRLSEDLLTEPSGASHEGGGKTKTDGGTWTARHC